MAAFGSDTSRGHDERTTPALLDLLGDALELLFAARGEGDVRASPCQLVGDRPTDAARAAREKDRPRHASVPAFYSALHVRCIAKSRRRFRRVERCSHRDASPGRASRCELNAMEERDGIYLQRVHRRVSVLAAIALVSWARPSRADDTFGLAIAVGEDLGAPVRSEAWVEEQIAAAERLFGPIGVHFRWTIRTRLPDKHLAMETRADRDGLADLLEPSAINVMIVQSLRDVDDPSLYRMGVCWRRRDGKPYLIVSASARPTVLAHELGHFFGNPHSTTPNNVMSYVRTDGEVFFDAAQIATIRRSARQHVAERWIVPVGPAKLLP
jgi:hypothetical protein